VRPSQSAPARAARPSPKKKKKGGLRAHYSNPSAKKRKNRKGDWQTVGNWGDRTNMDLQEAVKEVCGSVADY